MLPILLLPTPAAIEWLLTSRWRFVTTPEHLAFWHKRLGIAG